MLFSEKDIEDLIYDSTQNGQRYLLSERGLRFIMDYGVFFRQVDLGEYGRLDLVGISYDEHNGFFQSKKLNVVVCEIKKGEINTETLMQAIRYCKGIEHYLANHCFDIDFQIVLIGTSINKGDFCYATSILDNVNTYTLQMDLQNGIRFNKEDKWSLTTPRFNKLTHIENKVKKMVYDTIRLHVSGEVPELPF